MTFITNANNDIIKFLISLSFSACQIIKGCTERIF